MSLLMKALEKAAKDRGESSKTPDTAPAPGVSTTAPVAAGASASKSELMLEPITGESAIRPGPPSAPPPRATPPVTPPPRKPAAAGPATPRESAQAAAVIRAEQRESGSNIGVYLRDHPLLAIGTLVTLFMIGYGSYVYLQISNPGLFAKQPPPLTQSMVSPATSPPPLTASTVAPVPAAPAPTQSPPLTSSLIPPLQEVPAADKPRAGPAPVAAAEPPPASAQPPAGRSAVARPVPQQDVIKITAASAAPALNPVLAEAYSSLNSGNLESSQRLYNQLNKSDPGNVDALIGLAAIAMRQGDSDAAMKHYLKILELEPGNALAQAGLIGIIGRADPSSSETRVKQLIARDPSAAYLHFTLGNTYVDQNRWPDAQQSFFQAHHLQPDNPDYAYNLAVALEHIGQSKPALGFYRSAVQLAAAKGRANFSTDAAQERVAKLERLVQ